MGRKLQASLKIAAPDEPDVGRAFGLWQKPTTSCITPLSHIESNLDLLGSMESMRALRGVSRDLVGLVTLALASASGEAQSPASTRPLRGTIAGQVVDAGTLQPLHGATVVLLPGALAVLPPVTSTGSSFTSQARAAVTSEVGSYRFDDLPAGDYQLRVQRVGYRPVTLDVDLRGTDDARLSVGLTIAPIRLTALRVHAALLPPYGGTEVASSDEEASRIGAALLRQRLFLGTDVREVTHPDVMEAVTLGSTDFFRAFHRLPGVATRDDDAAELWTRGSRPDLTRIYFDGLPLFSALHSFGLLSGIGTSSVGAAFLHPGVRPASIGEGAAAIVDVRSRPGGGTGAIRGITELTSGPAIISSSSARAAFDQRILDGRAAWMLAGGRSVADLFRDGSGGTNAIAWPAYFADLTARFDVDLGAGRRLEGSGLWLRDIRRDNAEARPFAKELAWGSDLARATVTWPIGRFQSRHTIGASRFRARIDTLHSAIDISSPENYFWDYQRSMREVPLRSSLLHASLSGELEPHTREGIPPTWTLGYELAGREVDVEGDMRFALMRIESARSRRAQSSPTASLWGTLRLAPMARLRVEPGLRIEAGPAPSNAGVIRANPRLQARLAIDSQTAISAGVGRSMQYTQTVGRLERAVDGITFPSALWLAADDSTPAVRVDVATFGVERWLGASWLASANVYHRRSTGLLLRDPRPGPLLQRGLLVEGSETASGLEVGARKLAGRVTGSASYTYGDARTTAAGLVFASNQDRRHSFDVTLLARLKRSAQLSAAYTYAEGAPFTRLRSTRGGSPTDPYSLYREPADSLSADDPNAGRMPPYASLDLALEWMFNVGTARVSPYFQIQNVLRHRNFGPYDQPTCASCGDGFYRSRRLLRPTIGIRARF